MPLSGLLECMSSPTKRVHKAFKNPAGNIHPQQNVLQEVLLSSEFMISFFTGKSMLPNLTYKK